MADKKIRIETDSLGAVQVPANAYYGAFTARAQENFQISGITAPPVFTCALGIVKLAALHANTHLGLISQKHSRAIEQACKEFIQGEFAEEFTLDIFQAGAGTSYNMNANEIIANRANELLKNPKGSYSPIHPNNHINMGQSTNDVIPTATRIAVLFSIPALLKELSELAKAFHEIAKTHKNLLKVGRTHLQDAVPITLGQEFDSYKETLSAARLHLESQTTYMHTLGIGGTAVGTGIATHPGYQKRVLTALQNLTNLHFIPAKNLTESATNMAPFMHISGSLRALATNLLTICSDLKLMNMGPQAGLAEITLPPVQPGSSIMPGKVNPSIPESVEMVAAQAIGCDTTISICAQKSNFELNVMCPVIMYNLLHAMSILTQATRTLREKCISGITINTARITELYEHSLINATALAPYLGYTLTADIVKTALKKGHTLREEVRARKLYTEKELREIFSPAYTARPHTLKKRYIKKTQ